MPAQSARSALEDLPHLLAPLAPEFFFKEHWNRRALYLPGDDDKFEGLFGRTAFDAAVHHCSHLKINYADDRGWPAERAITPAEIPDLLASRKTICAGEVNRGDTVLTNFLAGFKKQFSVAGAFYFNAYLSADGSGFGLHLDNHPVWIFQIEGQKRWQFSEEPGLPQVVTNVSFPRDRTALKLPWGTIARPAPESLREVTLGPGDLLYLPKGAWHQAQAVGCSLGLTLAQGGVAGIDILQYALAPMLSGLPYRDLLPGFWSESPQAEIESDLEPRFAELLESIRSAVNTITPQQMIELWQQAHRQVASAQAAASPKNAPQ